MYWYRLHSKIRFRAVTIKDTMGCNVGRSAVVRDRRVEIADVVGDQDIVRTDDYRREPPLKTVSVTHV